MSLFTGAKDTIANEVRSLYKSNVSKRRHQKGLELERKLKWDPHNNSVAPDSHNAPRQISRQTDNPNNPRTKCLTATFNVEGEPQRITSASRTPIPSVDPLPKHIPHVPMNRYNCYSMLEDPIFIPYLGDDDKMIDYTSILSEQEMAIRKKATEEGPMMERDETNAILDQVLLESSIIQGIQVWKQTETTNYVLSALAQCACLSSARIQERYQVTIVPLFSLQNERTNTTTNSPIHPLEATVCGECVHKEGIDTWDADYLEDMDSFRALFCRKCFTYSCSVHCVESKPSLQLQHTVLLATDVSNQFPSLETDTADTESCFDHVKELSNFQKKLCKRAFFMCDGDYRRISVIVGAPEHLIQTFVQEHNFQLPPKSDSKFLRSRANQKVDKYSVKRYNQKWYNAIKNAEIHPLFTPCCHEEPCSEETCSCIQNRFFCTPACCWGALSPNFFRGCGCKGSCNASSCTCFAAKRECDPELCSCCPCSDPPDRTASKQQCRNDNIRMRRHAHLLLAPSVISGWGCFTKHALRKGDFIHEYVGELINQEVAEKRGQIDDAKNRSYLFNLSSDYALDGCRTGNKTRFINHSDKPNIETRTVFVNGDQRIGMFALEHVGAEDELFFDYRYNVSMSNDLIEMAKFKPAWLPNDEHEKPPSKPKLGKRKRSNKR